MRLFKHLLLVAIFTVTALCGISAAAQRMQNSNYGTAGYIKSDGTVQDSRYTTIGHIKSDGTVQDSRYTTIGHANGVKREWAAAFFFFFF